MQNSNSYNYYIFKDKQLVLEILKGSFNISEYVNLKRTESKDPDFNPNYNSILDIRDVDNSFTKELKDDLKFFSGVIKTIQPVTRRKRTAVITNTPSQVIGIIWYTFINDRDIDYKVFSTAEGAIDWLGVMQKDLYGILV